MSKHTAQPFIFDADKYRQSHRRLIAGVGGKVADVFEKTAKKIAKIGLSTGFDSDTEEFKWSDYPVQQKQAEKAVNGMLQDLVTTIEQGQVAAWDASNLKNDEMVKSILPTTDLPEDIVASFTPRNTEALKAFQERKVAGMNLSQRIWSFKDQSTREFEMALDVALGTGKSAAELSRDIRLSLKEPNNLFRRVRNKHGNLVPSKAMQAHKAGRGVYHSSYKNALRVAATETNMAYRHADNTRWRGMGFVLGIEVSTSINNHNPHPDMCDELAGVYPVDFEFVGWHPFCRCWAAPKLADRKEFEKYLDDLQDEKDVTDYPFSGRVEDVPQGFKDWVETNKARIENAANKPYFIRDNYVDGDLSKGFKFDKALKAKTMEELAAAKKAYTGDLAIGSDLRKKWAEKRAEIRNATRSEKERKAIEARIEQRRKDIAAFEKFKSTAGANIKANAGQLAWFDAKQLAELDRLAHRPALYRAKAKEMAQQIAAIRKDIKELETLIPDVGTTWSKQFTSEELHGVFDAVKKKIAQIESAPLNTYKWTDHLEQEAAKYKFEIYDYLGGNMGGVQQKYKTWKVSQAAYTKQLGVVEDKLWEKQAFEKINDLDALYQSHASSDKLKKFVDEAMDAYMAGDKGAFAAKAQEAEAWSAHLDKLTAQRKAREARKKAQAAGSPSTNPGTLGDLTDKEHAEAAQRLLEKRKKQGILTLSTKDVRKKWQEISEESIKANPDRAKINRILAELGEDIENPYSQSRRDAAVWITGDPFDSYKELAPQTSKVWKAAPQSERTAIYQYTYEYHNINEPLRGLTYIGSPSKAARGITNIGEITNLLEKTNLEHDMWFQRGDGMISLKKFGLIDFSTASDKEIKALVGKEGVEGAFWSSGSAKGKGFSGDVIFNIYAPKGTKGMYVEPFSQYGNGSCSDKWAGDLTQKSVGYENEFLFQRGTKFKITKAEKNAGTWFIDIEVVEQNVLPFPYVGGYPFL